MLFFLHIGDAAFSSTPTLDVGGPIVGGQFTRGRWRNLPKELRDKRLAEEEAEAARLAAINALEIELESERRFTKAKWIKVQEEARLDALRQEQERFKAEQARLKAEEEAAAFKLLAEQEAAQRRLEQIESAALLGSKALREIGLKNANAADLAAARLRVQLRVMMQAQHAADMLRREEEEDDEIALRLLQ